MRRAYLLAYNSTLGTREAVRDFLDNLPEVLNWKYDLPGSFYLISELLAGQLSDKLHKFAPQGRFIITEVDDNFSGWLPQETWTMIQHKLAVGEVPDNQRTAS